MSLQKYFLPHIVSVRERVRERERECGAALCVCLVCMPYMYALYVCLICMPYMCALQLGSNVTQVWHESLSCTYALYVCLICVPYKWMRALHRFVHWLDRLQDLLDKGQFDAIVKMDKTILGIVDELITREHKSGISCGGEGKEDTDISLCERESELRQLFAMIGSHLLYQLSLACRALGQHKEAIRYSRQAEDLSEGVKAVLSDLCDISFQCAQPLALAYFSAGEYEAARDIFGECLMLAKKEANALQQMTALHMMHLTMHAAYDAMVMRDIDVGQEVSQLFSELTQQFSKEAEMLCLTFGEMIYIPSRHAYQCGSRTDVMLPGTLDGGKSWDWFSEYKRLPFEITARCHCVSERARERESERARERESEKARERESERARERESERARERESGRAGARERERDKEPSTRPEEKRERVTERLYSKRTHSIVREHIL